MMSPRMLDLAIRYQVAAVLAFFGASLLLWPDGAMAVFAGGALGAANFWFLRYAAGKLLLNDKPKMAYVILLAIKFAVVLGAMAVMVLVLRLNALGIALGLFTLFIGIGGGTLHMILGPSKAAPQQP